VFVGVETEQQSLVGDHALHYTDPSLDVSPAGDFLDPAQVESWIAAVKSFVLDANGTATLLDGIRERARTLARPCVVALDGRSGAGKSTLAANIAEVLGACVLSSDDFFAGGVALRSDARQDRVRDCIDWKRQRPVLEALRSGRGASYVAFDWDAFDGRLDTEPTVVEPRPVVLFEGVYTARSELADLVDLRILLWVDDATRGARLLAREGSIGAWERQWHEAEEWYFTHLDPSHGFDMILIGPQAVGQP
jgi:uridine kinase